MNLLLLHATGLAWDEIGYLIIPGTLITGLVLFLSGRHTDQGTDEEATEAIAQASGGAGNDTEHKG